MFPIDQAFITFDAQDSGCKSYGVEYEGRRWFVKTATTDAGGRSLTRVLGLHAVVRHAAIVRPDRVFDGLAGPTIVYPFHEGTVLNAATVHGSARVALARFQALPVAEVQSALATILDAHLAIASAGYVAVDLYDGCFLYDFAARQMRVIDLDEYRPGPFVLDSERLPGSKRYMAPEEFARGARIDHRTSVHALGRTLQHLLDSSQGWRGTAAQRTVVERATQAEPAARFPGVQELVEAWTIA